MTAFKRFIVFTLIFFSSTYSASVWAQKNLKLEQQLKISFEARLKASPNLNTLNFTAVHSRGQHLLDCRWKNVVLDFSTLDQLEWRRCRVFSTSLEQSSLKSLSVRESRLSQVDFKNSDLRGSYWMRSSCDACDFRGADLRDSVFILAKMFGSKVSSKTVLPFTKDEAKRMGFIFEE